MNTKHKGITVFELLIVAVITIIAIAAIRPVSRYVRGVREVRYDQAPQAGIHDAPAVDNIYLLIGKRGNIPALPLERDPSLDPNADEPALERAREQLNWLNADSRWIVIGPQTGRVTTIENAAVKIPSEGGPNEDTRNKQIEASREFTRSVRRLGGR